MILLFKTFKSWKSYCGSGVCDVCAGLIRIFLSLILGVVSIVVAMWKSVKAFWRREFAASLVITAILLVLALGWLATFINERAARVNAEYERDSLSLVLSERVTYEPDTTVNYLDFDGQGW